MPVSRRTATALTLLASLALAATALAVTPKKGAKFKGTATGTVEFATSFTAKDPLSFTVSSSSKKLTSVAYTDSVCDLAASKLIEVGTVKVTGGRFSVSKLKSAPEGDTTKDGGTVVTTTSISGRFTSAKKATGTLEYSQKQSGSSTASCGPIKLKFSLSAA